ncbi:unnamed protein product [Rotaria sordida]|uniref:B30.2/SPRY domain-containing protein n=1 Tax=Rotaria sordida TaxID=392033 RepID=A0A818U788_9BILA|nr:unnamed protein product [Rotaria sordida]CAF3694387.1 unnamed protein product [Rotaria sordida]
MASSTSQKPTCATCIYATGTSRCHGFANNTRKQLSNAFGEHMNEIKKSSASLTEELRKARNDRNFVDTDLKKWIEMLDKLKKDSIVLLTIDVIQDNAPNPFISKIIINGGDVASKVVFNQTAGSIRIEDYGQVIAHDQMNDHGTARSKNEYSSAQHQFRFKIEHLHTDKWIFFGIVSRDAPMQPLSYSTPTTYGWGGNNSVYLNGVDQTHSGGYKSDLEINDIIELMIDCDRRTIRWTNQRTKNTHALDVDTNKCRFPWQLSVGLYYLGDRVRILS